MEEEEEDCEGVRWSSRNRTKAKPNYAEDPYKNMDFGRKGRSNNKKKKKPTASKRKPSSVKKDTPTTTPTNGSSSGANNDTPTTTTTDGTSSTTQRPRCAARHQVADENGKMVYVESVMCHQCQRNDKGAVVRCTKCLTKRYCYPCMDTWYPNMTHEMFAECCPVCQGNCNCKGCLRDMHPKVKENINFEPSADQKIQYSIYILHVLLPFLKRLNEEQIKEKQIEAKIQGCSLSQVRVKNTKRSKYEHMYCDCCKTSIFDLHRSCPSCHYDLCLQCCRELRDGNLQGNKEEVVIQFEDPGSKYLYGRLLEGVKRRPASAAVNAGLAPKKTANS